MISIKFAWAGFAKEHLCVIFSVILKLLITFSSFQTAEGMFANKIKRIIVNLIAHIVFINMLANWLFS